MKTVNAFLLAVSATAALGQPPPDPSEARNGDFGAKLLVTDDPDSFWNQWAQAGTPHLATTDKVTRERPVQTVIVFYDCAPGPDGNCDVTVDFEMIRPDGTPY